MKKFSFFLFLFFSLFFINNAFAVVDYSQFDYTTAYTGAGSSADFTDSTYNRIGYNFAPLSNYSADTIKTCINFTGALNGTVKLEVYSLLTETGNLSAGTLLATSNSQDSSQMSAYSNCVGGSTFGVEWSLPSSINFNSGEFFAFVLSKDTATAGGISTNLNSANNEANPSFYRSNGNFFSNLGTGSQIALGSSSITNSVLHALPSDLSTDSPALIHFTGEYSNNGDYDTLLILLRDITHQNVPDSIIVCDALNIGSSLPYSCDFSGQILTEYSYKACLQDSAIPVGTGGGLCETGLTSFTTSDLFFPLPEIGGNDCSTFDIGCYIIQALQYLFIPDAQYFNSWATLLDRFKEKPPFGYIYSVFNELTTLDTTGTSEFTLQSLPILNTYLFTPIRAGLSWIFWFAFLFVLFSRFKNIDL